MATTVAYRGDGLRDNRTTAGVTKTFTWDVAGSLPVVLDDGSKYVYGAGLISQTSGANTYYYLSDGLGSTMKTDVSERIEAGSLTSGPNNLPITIEGRAVQYTAYLFNNGAVSVRKAVIPR